MLKTGGDKVLDGIQLKITALFKAKYQQVEKMQK